MARIGFVLSYLLLELLDKVYFYNVRYRYHLIPKARENRNWLGSNPDHSHRKLALYPICLGLTGKIRVVFIWTATRGIYSQYYWKKLFNLIIFKIFFVSPVSPLSLNILGVTILVHFILNQFLVISFKNTELSSADNSLKTDIHNLELNPHRGTPATPHLVAAYLWPNVIRWDVSRGQMSHSQFFAGDFSSKSLEKWKKERKEN